MKNILWACIFLAFASCTSGNAGAGNNTSNYKEYKLIVVKVYRSTDDKNPELEARVNEALKNGYSLVGGVAYLSENNWAQAVAK